MVFSSGMAAIMTSMFAMLKAGDHIIFQNDLYGGTHHAALHELNRYGIEYDMVDAADPGNIERSIRKETKKRLPTRCSRLLTLRPLLKSRRRTNSLPLSIIRLIHPSIKIQLTSALISLHTAARNTLAGTAILPVALWWLPKN